MRQECLLRKITSENNLDSIQEYIKNVMHIRGADDQVIEQQIWMLAEEVKSFAKSIRKKSMDISTDRKKTEDCESFESKIADIVITVISICNTLDINLFNALVEKEKRNIKRGWQL